MNSFRKMLPSRTTSPLGIKPHTTAAIRATSFHLIGCSAYMEIILKSLSCCKKYAPQYLVLFGPIIIWLFVLTLHQTYKGSKKVIEDWKTDEAREVSITGLGQRRNQGTDQVIGKSKRKNHRGGVKARKAKGKREETGSSSSGEV